MILDAPRLTRVTRMTIGHTSFSHPGSRLQRLMRSICGQAKPQLKALKFLIFV